MKLLQSFSSKFLPSLKLGFIYSNTKRLFYKIQFSSLSWGPFPCPVFGYGDRTRSSHTQKTWHGTGGHKWLRINLSTHKHQDATHKCYNPIKKYLPVLRKKEFLCKKASNRSHRWIMKGQSHHPNRFSINCNPILYVPIVVKRENPFMDKRSKLYCRYP